MSWTGCLYLSSMMMTITTTILKMFLFLSFPRLTWSKHQLQLSRQLCPCVSLSIHDSCSIRRSSSSGTYNTYVPYIPRGGAMDYNKAITDNIMDTTTSAAAQDLIATFTQELEQMRRELEQEAEMEMSSVKIQLKKRKMIMKKKKTTMPYDYDEHESNEEENNDLFMQVDLDKSRTRIQEDEFKDVGNNNNNNNIDVVVVDDEQERESLEDIHHDNDDDDKDDIHVLYDVEYEYEEVFLTDDNDDEVKLVEDEEEVLVQDHNDDEEDVELESKVHVDGMDNAEIKQDVTNIIMDDVVVSDSYDGDEKDDNTMPLKVKQQEIELPHENVDRKNKTISKKTDKKKKSKDEKKKSDEKKKKKSKRDSNTITPHASTLSDDRTSISVQRSDATTTTMTTSNSMELFVKSLIPIFIISLLMFLSHLLTQFLMTKI